MYVGIFGDVIFSVGHLRVLTPSNFKGTTGANWAEHEVLGGKARAEYLSPKLREYTFDILLDAALGVNPRKMLNRLTEMSENGEIHYRASQSNLINLMKETLKYLEGTEEYNKEIEEHMEKLQKEYDIQREEKQEKEKTEQPEKEEQVLPKREPEKAAPRL